MERERKARESAENVRKMGPGIRVGDAMIKEELKWEKLRMRAAKRAWGFKEKLRAGKGSGTARRCLEEVERRGITGEGKSK